MVSEPKAVARRRKLRDALIGAAERTIATEGLRGMKARELAVKVGCAVGAIYNVFDDLDDLIFAVNALTLEQLEKTLTVAGDKSDPQAGRDQGAHPSRARLYRLRGRAHAALARAVRPSPPRGARDPDLVQGQPLATVRLHRGAAAQARARAAGRAPRADRALAVLRGARHRADRAGGEAAEHSARRSCASRRC